MIKRLFVTFLALSLLATLLPFAAFADEETETGSEAAPVTEEETTPATEETPEETPAQPEQTGFKASKELVELIKKWEGFAKYPVWDYGQYSVGYGTRAPDEHLERYRREGISEEEATQLLEQYMEGMGNSVNSFIDKFGLKVNQGQFDAAVRSVLHQLSQAYPQIRYGVVLAYLPKPGQPQLDNTMFPEELEGVPPKFAIDRRNKWMLKNSDYVICYLRYSWGGAYKFARMAQKSGKPVIQLNSRGGS